MERDAIYLPLQGRIGNQLFQYALARKIQIMKPGHCRLIIDDSDILRCNWSNSLVYYSLPNVEYKHSSIIEHELKETKGYYIRKGYRFLTKNKNYLVKYNRESRLNRFLGKNGLFICENGYLEPRLNLEKPIYLEGYFQSPKYFEDISEDLLHLLNGRQFAELQNYPEIDKLRDSNSVCISVKVEHNVGSSMYSVCTAEYWRKAIDYIKEKIENPLFFICSDDVDFVLNHLIDPQTNDYVLQNMDYPVHISLAAMAECKHFIIGNTTFGWWAQYLSKNRNKIVVAPSRWMNVAMPIDIYQSNWHLIDV